MVRNVTKLALASALGLAAVLFTQIASSRAQDKKDEKKEEKKTTKQIMGANHKGAEALFGKIQAAV
ncbi:MAG: hypothetical protein K2V38_08455, partial [Gemmataceae bacterium]|nr:hypothetical protein [Gemmataceae bacterium]